MKIISERVPLPIIFKKGIKPKIQPPEEGDKYMFNPRDGWLKREGHPCHCIYDLAKKYITNFDLALDVGCRFGEFAVMCKDDFKKTLCFDPHQQWAFDFNTKWEKVLHFQCALGQNCELIKMYGGMHPNSVKGENNFTYHEETAHIAQSIPLDLFLFDHAGIGLLKIDVEGFENRVLKGAKKTIKKHKPVIIIEQNEIRLKDEKKYAALSYLKELNYKIVEIHEDKDKIPLDYILIHKS